MTSRQLKQQMTDFLAARLEDSGLYDIRASDADGILLREKSGLTCTAYIFTHADKTPVWKVAQANRGYHDAGFYTAHVFLQDKDEFFRPLSRRERQYRKSLKHYKKEDIDRMVKLSDLERFVLKRYPAELPELAYYSPRPEAIVSYTMEQVGLDYSHLHHGDKGYGYAYNHDAFDYRFPDVKTQVKDGPAFVKLGNPQARRGLVRPYAAEPPQLALDLAPPSTTDDSRRLLTRDELAACCTEIVGMLSQK
jgi:hypothetical protein